MCGGGEGRERLGEREKRGAATLCVRVCGAVCGGVGVGSCVKVEADVLGSRP